MAHDVAHRLPAPDRPYADRGIASRAPDRPARRSHCRHLRPPPSPHLLAVLDARLGRRPRPPHLPCTHLSPVPPAVYLPPQHPPPPHHPPTPAHPSPTPPPPPHPP